MQARVESGMELTKTWRNTNDDRVRYPHWKIAPVKIPSKPMGFIEKDHSWTIAQIASTGRWRTARADLRPGRPVPRRRRTIRRRRPPRHVSRRPEACRPEERSTVAARVVVGREKLDPSVPKKDLNRHAGRRVGLRQLGRTPQLRRFEAEQWKRAQVRNEGGKITSARIRSYSPQLTGSNGPIRDLSETRRAADGAGDAPGDPTLKALDPQGCASS